MNEINKNKEEIAYFMQRLYKQGLTTTSGGNISFLLDDQTVLITPSGSDKGRITSAEIGHMTLDGKIMGKSFNPSIESQMHLDLYKARPDIKAVVHAHPPLASSFSANQQKINTSYLSESYAILGEIVYTEYYCMGTPELAEEVAKCSKNSNCIIMRNHGALATGESLLQAFDRLEVLESAAKITITNKIIGTETSIELSNTSLNEIDILMGR